MRFDRPERFFLSLAIVVGSLLVFLIPPFQTPDENVHFYRAYEVSDLKLPDHRQNGESGSLLPVSIRLTEYMTHGFNSAPGTENQISYNYNEKYNWKSALHAIKYIPLNQNEKTFYKTAGSPMYSPLSYAPQAAIVGVLKLVDTPVMVMFYAVRLVNLFLWIALTYLAVKIIPVRKWTLVGVVLFPVVITQAISSGLDPALFGCSALIVAMVTRFYVDEKYVMDMKRALALTIMSSMVVMAKPMLIVLLLPILFLPKKIIKVSRSRLSPVVVTLLILAPIVIYMGWQIFAGGRQDNTTYPLIAASRMTDFLENPLVFVWNFLHAVLIFTSPGNMLAQSFVGMFGWLDTPMSSLIVLAGFAYMAFVLILNYEGNVVFVTKKRKIFLNLMCFAYVLAVYFSMYIYATSESSSYPVAGVQGRYFVPAVLVGVLAWASSSFLATERSYIKMVRYGSLILILLSILTIFLRYYTQHKLV